MIVWMICVVMLYLSGEKSEIPSGEFERVISRYVHECRGAMSTDELIEFRSIPKSVSIDQADYSLNVASSSSLPYKGYAGIPVEIREKGKLVKTILCSIVLRRFEDVCVTSRDIGKNEPFLPIDINIQHMETTNLDDDIVVSQIMVVNTRSKRMIKSNTILKKSMLEEIPAVNMNDVVVIVVKTNNLSIAASGIAKQDGNIGEEIRFQRIGGREYLMGRVVGKKSVEIVVP